MNISVSIILFLIVSSLFSQETNRGNYLLYENYLENNRIPLEEIENPLAFDIRFFAKDTIGQNNIYPGACLSSSSELYDFLIEKDIVSGYVDIYEKENIPKDEYYMSKEDFIDEAKKSMKMYYLGKVVLDTKYESHLFSCFSRNSTSKMRKEFMVNIKNGLVQSIVVLTVHSLSDFGFKQYTIYLGNHRYIHGIKTLYSDIVGNNMENEGFVEFILDSGGFVIRN